MRQRLLHTVLAALLASVFLLLAAFVQGYVVSHAHAVSSSAAP